MCQFGNEAAQLFLAFFIFKKKKNTNLHLDSLPEIGTFIDFFHVGLTSPTGYIDQAAAWQLFSTTHHILIPRQSSSNHCAQYSNYDIQTMYLIIIGRYRKRRLYNSKLKLFERTHSTLFKV